MKKYIGFVLIMSLFVFIGGRFVFAQTTTLPVSHSTNVNEGNGNNNDFNDDVQQGKEELKKDSEAQKLQKEVVDSEDQQAGDEEDNNIHEDSNLQEADQQQGIDEANQDNNNSEIDQVDDSNNLDEQSQQVIDEHQQEQDQEIQQEENQGSLQEDTKGEAGQENSQSDQNQPEASSTDQGQY